MTAAATAPSGEGSAIGLIDPAGAWPGDDLNPAEIAAAAAELRSVGEQIAGYGTVTSGHWRRLSGSWEAPEAAQLLAAMDLVRAEAETCGSNTAQAARALESFADEAARVKQAVAGLRARAVSLRDSVAAQDAAARSIADIQLRESAPALDPLAAARAASAALVSEVSHWAAALTAAEQTCAASIAACTDPMRFTAEPQRSETTTLTGTRTTPKSFPWGPPTDRAESGWGAVFRAVAGLMGGYALRGPMAQQSGGAITSLRGLIGAPGGVPARSAVADVEGNGTGGTQGGAVPEGGGLQPVGPEGGPRNGPEGQGYKGSNPEEGGRWAQWHRGNGGPYYNGTWAAREASGKAQAAESRAFETTQAEAAVAESVPNGAAQAVEARVTISAPNEPAFDDDAVIDEALSGLAAGRRPHVKVVENQDELEATFAKLTEQAAPETSSGTYKGQKFRLPGGTIIGMRQSSLSGGATIDIRRPDGDILKVHVEPRKR